MSEATVANWEERLAGLRPMLAAARSAVVLTGAGFSVESGLGTFRGPGGVWEKFDVEELGTPQAFAKRPGIVWRWYADRWRAMRAASPNAGHSALVLWERLLDRFLLVTQNIDGLHQRVGSKAVLELHGGLGRARCVACDTRQPMDRALELPTQADDAPRCACGARLRPDIVWFYEMLPDGAMERAVEAVERCDLFVAAGTSATVYPAAGLIEIARQAGATVVEVNPDAAAISRSSHGLVGPSGVVLPRLTEELQKTRRD